MTHRELQFFLLLVMSSAGGCLLPEVPGLDDVDYMDLGREGLLYREGEGHHVIPPSRSAHAMPTIYVHFIFTSRLLLDNLLDIITLVNSVTNYSTTTHTTNDHMTST